MQRIVSPPRLGSNHLFAITILSIPKNIRFLLALGVIYRLNSYY